MKKKILIISSIVAVVLTGIAVGLFIFLSRPAFFVAYNNVAILEGQDVNPSDFLALFENPEGITVTADELTGEGERTVSMPLRFRLGWRSIRTTATVYILSPPDVLEVEVGTPATHVPHLFVQHMFSSLTGAIPQDTFYTFGANLPDDIADTTGAFPAEIIFNNTAVHFSLMVTDTAAPTATPVNTTISMGTFPTAYAFAADIFDHSPPVSVAFAYEPDFFQPGEQTVEIVLTDRYGNVASIFPTLTIEPNTIPPTIYGVTNLYILIDSAAMFRRGVSAEDAFGRSIDFTVDSSEVDVRTLGVYQVTYRAVDAWGLYTEQTAEVTIVGVDPEDVRERAGAILDTILREGMTQVEQARAIFNWIGNNVGYAAAFEHRNIYESAHQALTHRRGNCFVFYSLSEIMLTLAGIPNMRIQRADVQPRQNRHMWNLINPDEMGWHHFDATPVRANINRFMFTQTQAEAFTRRIQNELGSRNYYHFDPDLYPEIVR